MNVISGLTMTAILVAASPLIARFYGENSLLYIISATSFIFLINSFSGLHYALMTKNFQFKKLALIGLASTLISGAVTIILGVKGFGIWSLVIGSLVGPTASAIPIIILSNWKPRFGFDRKAFKDLFWFGATLMFSNLIWRLSVNADQFIIGKYVGFAALGYYSRAYGLITLTANKISALVEFIAFPAYSKIQDEKAWLQIGYLRATSVVALLVLPITCAVAVLAPEFILLIYGPRWNGTVAPLRILSLASILSVAYAMSNSVLIALGKAKVYFNCQMIRLILIIAATLMGSLWGLSGVCWAVCLVNLIYLLIMQLFINKFVGVTLKRALINLLPPLTLTAVMAVVIYLYKVGIKLVFNLNPYAHLATSAMLGGLAFFLSMKIFRFKEIDNIYQEAVSKLKEKFFYLLKAVRTVSLR
jgi:PST family polysaccharide transporter